ncbi:MAG: hypothetical protein NC115_01565 [Bacteroidales bacterium]|nr:hypothetical protein [Bacteroidales bacterium]
MGVISISDPYLLKAEAVDGLMFHSYELTPSKRTSLQIPAAGKSKISFSDSLCIDFSLNVDTDVSKFGYICRIILNDSQSIDLVQYTSNDGVPNLCATGDHVNLIYFPLDDSWQDISIHIERKADSLVAHVNSALVASLPVVDRKRKSKATLCFGQNNIGYFATTDVASMTIRDLEIRTDRRKYASSLHGARDLDCLDRLTYSVYNPLWRNELNTRWNKMWSAVVPSNSFICYDAERALAYFISSGQVCQYDVKRKAASLWTTGHNIRTDLVTNDFVILKDGSLAYLDRDLPRIIRFDYGMKDWVQDNDRKGHSIYLHTNIVHDSSADRYFSLFGYGYHRYSNELQIWNPATGEVIKKNLDLIPPRYLAAAGQKDNKIYVFGGKGNNSGAQELGSRLFGDLFAVDKASLETVKVWAEKPDYAFVAASDLVFEQDSDSFLALLYNPNEYNTHLQLYRFNLSDGTSVALCEPIPYNFLDIQSEARLVYCAQNGSYLALVSHKNDEGQFEVAVYSIVSPIVSAENSPAEYISVLYAIVAAMFLLGIAAIGAVYGLKRMRMRRESGENTDAAVPDPPHSAPELSGQEVPGRDFSAAVHTEPLSEPPAPGIYFLGGFKVVSVAGEDITSSFSPLMRQLLCLLVLNSVKPEGISSNQLKEILWFDKSDNSYNNNRGVTLTKIRAQLAPFADAFQIISKNGYWKVEDNSGISDYLRVNSLLSSGVCHSGHLLQIAALGQLLPDMRHEWLDAYKAKYENRMLENLRALCKEIDDDASALFSVSLADAILVFDALDEDAVKLKCQALVFLNRIGSAKKVFDAFADNYCRMMGEKFDENFSDFIKNRQH